MIAPLVGVVLPIIHKTDRVKNDVIMNMSLVYVGREDKFILAAQHFICQLHANLMSLFRRDLPPRIRLYQVAAQVGALVYGMAAGPGKFYVGGFCRTPKGGYQDGIICFSRIADIGYGLIQRCFDRMCLCNCHIYNLPLFELLNVCCRRRDLRHQAALQSG